ncbi:type I restriction enzyme M protein [Clostridium tetanomorphum]|uniref:site-specific DNA-methyltransferase (adenine-specific) n=1 Tax=Clostridium tetanomorphum TaxID=1553 RepID=A0A923J101_CLOTT|nr:class I SAM-dependent DNA methyltransferase [Clostridium tetanomorphum]KAJ48740.1 type I restriction modification system M subunit [Clostridium tetanomorphum DSM 665]KAJ53114.1 type I restriction modification system M subunit [Clostridium tetanomorphum DSM 665]MBC2398801.1 SAM-dependent DNA methyltransferase [Clostridium tetanomorphum]MBP1863540.1 type I restriction enzyme M protein [Clostridium tetanomorphum]NRS83639.1 type I restriction enzyme M protein [Clostridium tetanomorphum]
MITGELKSKIDRIWETFWTGGITNPLEVIEQFTYFLFIKDLDDNETLKESDAELLGIPFEGMFPSDKQYLRWSKFKNEEAGEMYRIVSEEVFPFIKNIHGDKQSAYSKYMSDAMFKIPTPLLLSKIVDAIDKLEIDDKEVKGDLYEYLLSKVATAGTNGQFRTPRQIIKMMAELMKPTPEDIIVDPAMGTAGFLVGAEEYLREKHNDLFLVQGLKEHFNNKMFNGFDMDRTMLRIGAMNMMLHGVDNPNIEYKDSLSETNKDSEKYTLVLANPPFKGSLDYEAVSADLLKVSKTKKTELLFLALFLRILKTGGRCASIVPDGVLFGSTKGHKDIRKEIVDKNKLEAIISMPSGVFKPYAGVSTAIIIFTKTGTGGTDKVWFYDMKADGYSLDDKRNPIEENDIPDIIERFNNLDKEEDRKRTEQSFFVPVEEIRENGYDLSINKYKEIEYEEVKYDEPKVILERVKKLEKEITEGLNELERMIEG